LIWSRIFLSSMIKVKDFPKVVVLTLNNISERKRIQTDLEYERYFLQTLMDNIPDAIYFKDANHRFLKVSKYVHLKGMSDPAQAIGKTDFDFFTGEHANEAYEDEEEIIRTGKPLINKLEKETFPNGEIAWVSTTKAPLFSKEGTVSGIVGISRDLTEIKLKEEALQKSEERYRNLIEYAPDTIAVLCENEIIFTNAAGITLMSAKNKEEILNHRIEEFLHPQYFALTKYFLEQILKSQKPAKAPRIKLIRCDGALFDAEITGIPTTYFDKKAIQLVIRDITETKKQEKIKQTTLKILQASNYSKTIDELFKLIHHAVSNLMPAKNFYISLFDEKTELLSFPYFIDEEDEIMEAKPLGKGLTEYILRNGKAELITEQQDLDLREKGEVELRGAPAKIWLGVPLQIKEKTIGVMVVQDYHNENAYGENEKEILEMISFSVSRAIERRKAEEEILKYIDKLKDTNATKDRFFSFISHDLRGPFSSLLGFSEMILEDFDSFSKEDIRKYVSTIKATSQNLYNLLNNLLQFTRFQTGRILFNPMRTSIKEVVAKNIEMLKGNCIKKDIELITEVKNDDIVLIDEEMISSTIQNLITNAIKFTPRKGWIKITSQRRENEGMIEISVQDSGIGMNSTVMDNLFRVDVIQTTIGTEKESGTGLGLILAKESVEKHKGKIWAESHKGKGSTFRFTLPLAN
ncbi:MAG: PAS domain S-box protein, partial [Methanococcaceae archaeon]